MMRLLSIALFVLFSAGGLAQDARLILENPEIRIGEPAVVHLSFSYPNPGGEALIGWPQFDGQLTDDLEILDRTVDFEHLTDSASQTYTSEQNLQITAWEEGLYLIPAQKIQLDDSVYYTNTEMIKVNTVEVDTSKGIVDITDNYEIEYTWQERTKDWFSDNWYWFAGAGLIALIFLLFRVLKKDKTEEEEKVPPVPAHITALSSLNDLKAKEAWKSDNKKDYYSTLTDTVRLYLEQRFGIYAMEQTTREILQHLKYSDISDEDKTFLKSILSQADMVKFARFKPNNEDGFTSLNKSIDFVERTRKTETMNDKPLSDENQPD